MIEEFNAELHADVIAAYRNHPGPLPVDVVAPRDGLTHYCAIREGLTAPLCGSADGTRLHNSWMLVDCHGCREAAAAPELVAEALQ